MKLLFLILTIVTFSPLAAHADESECQWAIERCRQRCEDTFPNHAQYGSCVASQCTRAKHSGACGGNPSAFTDAEFLVPQAGGETTGAPERDGPRAADEGGWDGPYDVPSTPRKGH